MIVTFGIKPSHPNIHYGYIQQGKSLNEGVFNIASFTEKPSEMRAKEWIASGDYHWNSGMFVFQAAALLDLIKHINPALLAACQKAQKTHFKDLSFIKYDATTYQAIEAISFDYAIMEKTRNAVMVPLDITWSDLGTWENVKEYQTPEGSSNAIIGNVVEQDTENCYLHASSRLLVAMGLKDQIVVETPDAVLVADAAQSHAVKDMVKMLKKTGHREASEHPLVHRPWGSYQTLILSDRFQVKMLSIKPGARLSKQKHLHRAEHWVVVAGTAEVLRGTDNLTLTENQSVYIPIGAVHYIENPGHIDLKIIEVQTGSYLGEDDIIRLEDRYGRVKS
jgi:mannose-1-phosphate guanylyltransferase/mannose-6-phosphate isomerase